MSSPQAVPPTAPERAFTARDLFDLEAASNPQISPDGRWIAYVRRSGDIMTDRFRRSIWLVDTASGAQSPLATGASQPVWSPDGTRLYSYVGNDTDGFYQLLVLDPEGVTPAVRIPAPGNVGNGSWQRLP